MNIYASLCTEYIKFLYYFLKTDLRVLYFKNCDFCVQCLMKIDEEKHADETNTMGILEVEKFNSQKLSYQVLLLKTYLSINL